MRQRKGAQPSTVMRRWERANVESARIILADLERYGGNDAGLVRWARRVIGQSMA